jgi:hypothetical protein
MVSAGWTRYIAGEVKQSEARDRPCMKAVGEVIGKDVVALERRCERFETQLREGSTSNAACGQWRRPTKGLRDDLFAQAEGLLDGLDDG